MIRFDIPYVDTDRTLTQAGYEVLKGQDRRIDTLEAVDATEAANAPGAAPRYACRAWVNFNGTGTVAIRAAGNVSSITDSGVGNYVINFATAMTDANYASAGAASGGTKVIVGTPAAGSLPIATTDDAGAAVDPAQVHIVVFRCEWSLIPTVTAWRLSTLRRALMRKWSRRRTFLWGRLS